MPDQKDAQYQSMRAVAALAACIVQTMNEADPAFEARFLQRLETAYQTLRDYPVQGDEMDFLQLAAFVRELLTGRSWAQGQQKPFLGDYKPRQ